jgi:hypothetical protein
MLPTSPMGWRKEALLSFASPSRWLELNGDDSLSFLLCSGSLSFFANAAFRLEIYGDERFSYRVH